MALYKNATSRGITTRASWILEDNRLMRQAIENFGGDPYKTYRLYDRRSGHRRQLT